MIWQNGFLGINSQILGEDYNFTIHNKGGGRLIEGYQLEFNFYCMVIPNFVVSKYAFMKCW